MALLRPAIVVAAMLFVAGCQGGLPRGITGITVVGESVPVVEKEKVPTKPIEPGWENLSLKELEDYISLAMTGTGFSVDTILLLSDEYFAETNDLLADRNMRFEEAALLFKEGKTKIAPEPPLPDHTNFIKALKQVYEKYPDKAEMEMVIYALGYTSYEMGYFDESIEYYKRFVEVGRFSPAYEEVSFRLGELYFDAGFLKDALDSYKRILERPKGTFPYGEAASGLPGSDDLGITRDYFTIFYSKALYKTAWTYYKLEDFSISMDFFIRLVNELDKSIRTDDDPSLDLRDEAFAMSAKSLSHLSIPEGVKDRMAPLKVATFGPRLLAELGKALSDQARLKDAIAVYMLFQEEFPGDRLLPLVYSRLAEIYTDLDKTEVAMSIKRDLVEKFNPETPWYHSSFPVPEGNRDSLSYEKVDAIVGGTLLYLTKLEHEEAKKNNDEEQLKLVVEGYKRFIKNFSGTPAEREANLLLAESAFDVKDYIEAARRYEKTMMSYISRGDEEGGEGSKEAKPLTTEEKEEGKKAALAALLSLELTLINSGGINPDKAAASAGRIKDFFLHEFGETKELEDVLHKVADIYLLINYHDEARETLDPLLTGKSAPLAFRKTGDVYFAQKDFLASIEAYEEAFKKNRDEELKEKLARAHYVVAGNYADENKNEEAVKHFRKVFSISKGSKLGEDALINIGYLHARGNEMGKFKSVVKLVRKHYPESRGPFNLYLEGGKIQEINDKPIDASALFVMASELAETPTDAERLIFKAADMLEDGAAYKKAAGLIKKKLSSGAITEVRRIEALFRTGDAQLKGGDKRRGRRTLEELVSGQEKAKDEEKVYVAKARFSLAGLKFEEFGELRIEQPFEESLRRKQELMRDILGDYTYVIKSKIAPLQPEAFHMVGRVFENLKDSLLNSERPSDMTAEELDEYNYLLEERAYPLEEEAVKAYQSGFKASVNISNGAHMQTAIESLASLKPALYKREFSTADNPIFITPRPVALKPVE